MSKPQTLPLIKNWAEAARIISAVLESDCSLKGRNEAREELAKMARVADLVPELLGTLSDLLELYIEDREDGTDVVQRTRKILERYKS